VTGRWTAGVARRVLPNGLVALVQRDGSSPAATLVLRVAAGFLDEPDEWAGISHVLEHMYFKGTARLGPGEVARRTKALGGHVNAATSYDHTTYCAVLPARHLDAALAIHADALRAPALDAGELARELRVIIEEARRKADTPAAVAQETLHAQLFDRHRIRRWRIGTEAQLAGYGRADVAGYHAARYAPDRTIVAIVGDVDEAAALDAVARAFGDWAAAAPPRPTGPGEPPRREVRVARLERDVRRAQLAVGWRSVAATDPDAPRLDLAAGVLSAGRGSWLWRAVREPGLATAAGAWQLSTHEVGIFGLSLAGEAGRMGAALAEAGAAVHRLATDGPDAASLERTRTLMLARWARGLETTEARASALAAAEALGDVAWIDREHDALASATAAEVRDAVARHADPGAAAAAAVVPAGALLLSPDELERALGARRAALPAPKAWAPPRRPARAPAPAPHARRSRAGAVHVPLAGADLLVWPKPGAPLVTLGFYRRRVAGEPASRAGVGALALRAALRGAGDLDAASLAQAAEAMGGTIAPSVGSDVTGFALSVLSDRLGDAAALLALVDATPRLDEADIAAERALLRAEAVQAADDMYRYPFQRAFHAAFGDGPYGMPVAGVPETLDRLAPEDVRAWQRQQRDGSRPVLVAVGDLAPEPAIDALARGLGNLPDAAAPAHAAPPVSWVPGPGPRVTVEEREKQQTALALLFPGPSRREPAHYAATVWAAIAGGLGGRLFEALRDRRSLGYSVVASAWVRPRAGALAAYVATSPAREEEAREVLLAELAASAAAAPGPEEFDRAVAYLAGQAEVARQSAGAMAGELLDHFLAGDDLDGLADPGAPYRRTTPDDVREAVRALRDPACRAEAVLRGGQPSSTRRSSA